MSHPMTNREWVTLLYCGLINHVSSHDQQEVSNTALLQSHQSFLIPWPTVCEWHCFLINHVLSHDQQPVSDAACKCSLITHAISSHDHSLWVTLLDCSLITHVSYHDEQPVSDTAWFWCQAISSMLITWPTGSSEWQCSLATTLPSHTWPIDCKSCEGFYHAISLHLIWWATGDGEWYAIFASHFPSHDQQKVSDSAFVFLLSHFMITNSKWVMHYLVISHYIF